MAIADLYAAGAPDGTTRGPACTVCRLLDTLPPVEAGALRKLLSDPLWRYSDLSDALAEEGHKIKAFTLARHARGQCSAGDRLRGA